MHSPKLFFRSRYFDLLLPAIRGGATPCFRFAVRLAASLGLVPQALPAKEGEPKRFTIVHLSSHVGDTVMLLPMVEALREAYPDARIECAVEAPMAHFLSLVPSIDHIYAVSLAQGPTSTPVLELKRTMAILRFYWRTMRQVRPSICIVPRWGCGFRDLMLSYLLQAPTRIGFASNDFDRSQPPAGYRDTLLTCLVRGAQGMSDPEKFVFLLEQSGLIPRRKPRLVIALSNASVCAVSATVNWFGLASRLPLDPHGRFAVLAPGASAPKKVWPADRWAAVIQELHVSGLTVVLLSGVQDAEDAKQLYRRIPGEWRGKTVLVAGSTSLAESTCLLAHAQLFIGNDSGPGHLAGALGVPSVILFIAADGADPNVPFAPERVRPIGPHVACCRPARALPPCVEYCLADSAHCILQISTGDVLEAVTRVVQLPRAPVHGR